MTRGYQPSTSDFALAGYRPIANGAGQVLKVPVLGHGSRKALLATKLPRDEGGLDSLLDSVSMPKGWCSEFRSRFAMVFRRDPDGNKYYSIEPRVDVDLVRDLSDVKFPGPGRGKPVLCYADPDDLDHDPDCPHLHEGAFLWSEEEGPRVAGSSYAVLPAIADAERLGWSICLPPGMTREQAGLSEVKSGPKQNPKYSLHQVLTDRDVQERVGLDPDVLAAISRTAVVSPPRAATLAQEAIREKGVDAKVTVPKNYFQSKGMARAVLKEAAAHTPSLAGMLTSLVDEDEVIYYDPDSTLGGWAVRGPMKDGQTLMHIVRLVMKMGLVAVNSLFSYQLTVLDCYLTDEQEQTIIADVVNHVSDGSFESLTPRGRDLTANQQVLLSQLRANIRPVSGSSDGDVVATAVQVTPGHALINEHVLGTLKDIYVGGCSAAAVQSITHDVWVAEVAGTTQNWALRSPEVGETCVLMYASPGGSVEISREVVVRSAKGSGLMTTKLSEMRPGVSGAALVSVVDGALLGMYRGISDLYAVYTQVSAEDFSAVASLTESVRVTRASGGGEDPPYVHFVGRGLRSVVNRAFDSLKPLYDGWSHVGMGVSVGSRMVTTIDPDSTSESLSYPDNPGPRWDTSGPGVFYTDYSGPAPLLMRRVVYGEAVYVVGRDKTSPYFSEPARVVRAGLGGANFSLTALKEGPLPLIGGIVLAVSDAAVLGQYVGPTIRADKGPTAYCLALKRPATGSGLSAIDALAARFPYLTTGNWPDWLRDGFSAHGSLNAGSPMRYLAKIGDAYARIVMYKSLWAAGVPYETWARESKCLENSSMAEACQDLGLSSLLRHSPDINFAAGNKVYADLLEAIIGAALLVEPGDVVERMCREMGLVYEASSTDVVSV